MRVAVFAISTSKSKLSKTVSRYADASRRGTGAADDVPEYQSTFHHLVAEVDGAKFRGEKFLASNFRYFSSQRVSVCLSSSLLLKILPLELRDGPYWPARSCVNPAYCAEPPSHFPAILDCHCVPPTKVLLLADVLRRRHVSTLELYRIRKTENHESRK